MDTARPARSTPAAAPRRLPPAGHHQRSQPQWLTRNSEVASWSNAVWNRSSPAPSAHPTTRRSPAPVHDAGDDRRSAGRQAVPVRRRLRPLQRPRCPTCGGTPRHTWADGMTPGARSRCALLRRQASEPGARHQQPSSRGASTSCSPRACTTSRAASRSSAPTRSCPHRPTPRSPPSTGPPGGRRGRARRGRRRRHDRRGLRESPVLLRVGSRHGRKLEHPRNPTTLSDVYFRVGGPHIGKTHIALESTATRPHRPQLGVARRPRRRRVHRGRQRDTDRWRTKTPGGTAR